MILCESHPSTASNFDDVVYSSRFRMSDISITISWLPFCYRFIVFATPRSMSCPAPLEVTILSLVHSFCKIITVTNFFFVHAVYNDFPLNKALYISGRVLCAISLLMSITNQKLSMLIFCIAALIREMPVQNYTKRQIRGSRAKRIH